jgi:hypothetical protein
MSGVLGPEEAELKTLESAFELAWDAVSFPAVYGDNEFKGEKTKPWVRLSILPTEGQRADLGGNDSPRHEFKGVIVLQCFIPRSGDKSPQWVAALLTTSVRAIFQDKEFVTETGGHLICFNTSYRRVPLESSWARYNIRTPYRRDEVFLL